MFITSLRRRTRGASNADVDPVPFSAQAARHGRRLRGGPRTPLTLLPLIAICAGVGLAYVSQTAHATQATYDVTRLSDDQQRLVTDDQRLGNDLGRLSSSARIDAAAQQIGMLPHGRWSYVAVAPVQVVTSGGSAVAVQPHGGSDAVTAVIGLFSGDFGGNRGR